MDLNDNPERHPRVASKTRLRHDGGDPCNHPRMIGHVSWVPASAGMTLRL